MAIDAECPYPTRFQVIEELSRRPDASVVRAKDRLRQGEEVVLRAWLLPNAASVSAFRRHTDAWQTVSDRGVVQLVSSEIVRDGEVRWGVTAEERVYGRTLAHFTADAAGACGILYQLASGLAALNGAGIHDVDVSPTNVLVRRAPDGEFGVLSEAVLVDLPLRRPSLEARVSDITVQYSAPEVLDGRPPTAASGLYSLGCLLLRVLTGHPPFGVGELPTIITRQRNRELPRLGELSGEMATLVRGLLEPNPLRREFASAAELCDALLERGLVDSQVGLGRSRSRSNTPAAIGEVLDCLTRRDSAVLLRVGAPALSIGRVGQDLYDRLSIQGVTLLAAGGQRPIADQLAEDIGQKTGHPVDAAGVLDAVLVASRKERMFLVVTDCDCASEGDIDFIAQALRQSSAMSGAQVRIVAIERSAGGRGPEVGGEYVRVHELAQSDRAAVLEERSSHAPIPTWVRDRVCMVPVAYREDLECFVDEMMVRFRTTGQWDIGRSDVDVALRRLPPGERSAIQLLQMLGGCIPAEIWGRITEALELGPASLNDLVTSGKLVSLRRRVGAPRLEAQDLRDLVDLLDRAVDLRRTNVDLALSALRLYRIAGVAPRRRWSVYRVAVLAWRKGLLTQAAGLIAWLSEFGDHLAIRLRDSGDGLEQAQALRRAGEYEQALAVLLSIFGHDSIADGLAGPSYLEEYVATCVGMGRLVQAQVAQRRLAAKARAARRRGGRSRVGARLAQLRARQHASWRGGDTGRAVAAARREVDIASSVGWSARAAGAANNKGAFLLAGDAVGAACSFEQAAVCWRRLGNVRANLTALNNLARATEVTGGAGAAIAVLNRVRLFSVRAGNVRQEALSYLNIGIICAKSGRLRRARRAFSQAKRLAVDLSDNELLQWAYYNLALVAVDDWRFHLATRYADAINVLAPDSSKPAMIRERMEQRTGAGRPSGPSMEARLAGATARFIRRRVRTIASFKRLRDASIRRGCRRQALALTRRFALTARSQGELAAVGEAWSLPALQEGNQELRVLLGAVIVAKGPRLCGLELEAIAGQMTRAQSALRRRARRDLAVKRMARRAIAQARRLLSPHGWRGASLEELLLGRTLAVLQRLRDTEAKSWESAMTANVPELLSLIMERTGAERAAFVRRSETGQPRIDVACGDVRNISWATVRHVLQKGEAIVQDEALGSEEMLGQRSIVDLKVRSLLCLPVAGDSTLLGALYLDHRSRAGAFSSDEVRIATVLGAGIARSLEEQALRSAAAEAGRTLAAVRGRMMEAERVRMAGELTTGVAHDLKNMLTTILGRLQLMRIAGPVRDGVERSLDGIEQAARAGVELIERLQQCARNPSGQPEQDVSLLAVVNESVDLLRPRILRLAAGGRGVNVTVEGDAELGVRVVVGELREAIVNLLVNAIDAVAGGGQVVCEVRLVDGRVGVEVRDTGGGMPSDTVRRAFDPFFTTKGDSGTGLGLAIVRRIAIKYGGDVRIRSQLGAGTAVLLVLPARRGEPAAPHA